MTPAEERAVVEMLATIERAQMSLTSKVAVLGALLVTVLEDHAAPAELTDKVTAFVGGLVHIAEQAS